MKMNNFGIRLIKKYEGLQLRAYVDPATGSEPFTIGYGTTVYPNGLKVRLSDMCTQEQAEEYLMNDIKKFSNELIKLIPEKCCLNDNQFSALVSFTYNIGIGNFKKSTLLKYLNENKKYMAGKEILKWHKANGKSMLGLVRRRIEELYLYEQLP